MSFCIISASEADSVLKGKQKYCLSSMGPLDKKALKKGLKETAATMKKAHKETLRKCKKCEHYNKSVTTNMIPIQSGQKFVKIVVVGLIGKTTRRKNDQRRIAEKRSTRIY